VAPAAVGAVAGHAVSFGASRYFLAVPQEFKLKEKFMSLSGDAFQITNCATGTVVFKMKGHLASVVSEKKTLSDANGVGLYRLSEAVVSFRDRMFITDAQSRKSVLTVRKKGVFPKFGSSTVLCFRGGSDEGPPYLSIKGDLLRKAFTITDASSSQTVATVQRKSSFCSVIMETDSYVLRVEAGIDPALMCTLVVALDEQYRDN
jgi:uncharacterized protein YxjI